jgi:hypothetical protein
MPLTSPTFLASSVRRFLLVGCLAVLAALLIIPRAAGQGTTTLEFDVVLTPESIEVAKALGNQPDPAVLARGDVRSAQGGVRIGDEQVGTFYSIAVVTFETQHFATAANHVHVNGSFELFGEGTLAVTGLLRFTGPSTVAITGGTGAYVGAEGQCAVTHVVGSSHWVCEVH